MRKAGILILLCLVIFLSSFQRKALNNKYIITDFGAKADSATINTNAIQSCIDKCSAEGGGTVVIPKGTFLSGAIFLKKNVNLTLEKYSKLKGSIAQSDYPQINTRWEGEERVWTAALLNAIELDNIKISGEGTIDGSGDVWVKQTAANRHQISDTIKGILVTAKPRLRLGRPRLIAIQNCRNIRINDLHLHNQASWGLFVLYSTGVQIEHLNITAEHNLPSSDGIDIDSSNQIHISETFIDVNDDCISIKSGKDEDGLRVNRPSENILIEKCHFAYGHGGVAMGSETSGGIRNVEIRDCLIDSHNWAPIRFKSQPSRGGVVENITYRNIRLNNVRKAFEFNMTWRMINAKPPSKILPVVRNIKIINVSGTADMVGDIEGLEGSPLLNLNFSGCSIQAKQGLIIQYANKVNFSGLTISGFQGEKIKKTKVNYQ